MFGGNKFGELSFVAVILILWDKLQRGLADCSSSANSHDARVAWLHAQGPEGMGSTKEIHPFSFWGGVGLSKQMLRDFIP